MAQGLRVRMGLGVMLCSGLFGCMNDDKKPLTPPPQAKGTAPGGVTGRTNTPPGPGSPGYGMQPGGTGGVQPAGGMQPGYGGQPVGNAGYNMPANPRAPGMTGTPTVPGVVGAGGSIPGASTVIPQVGPASSNYPPGYGTGGQPVAGARADVPPVALTDPGLAPPVAPGYAAQGGQPVDVAPPVPPPGFPQPPTGGPPGYAGYQK